MSVCAATRAQSEVLEGILREVYTRQAMWTSAEVAELVRDEHITDQRCRPVERFALNLSQEKCRQALRAFDIFPLPS